MKTTLLAMAYGFLSVAAAAAQRPDTLLLRPGLVITRSAVIASPPGPVYRLAPASGDSAVITIRGSNLTVDFRGVVLEGIEPGADPDQASGVALRVEGGEDVTIRNARIRGYKVGLLARGTSNLRLFDNDFSHNWKPRLFSLVEHESLVDWLSHHRNESDEWLRFGAGVYLVDVRRGEVRGNRIEQGMEGLMLVRSDSLLVWNNVIQFNSGVGIALYRSNRNRILHNHASFNVRGYSHGFYRRGQDSADLLMYEQSSHNIVAFNSMTHGGDGLFLWAGQSTMDTGQGGANDNLFYANDFSYAPTNAMEATFSRNYFINNRAVGSDHGLWGGYSYDSKVIGNDFSRNRIGIAIEHGQNNQIMANRFQDDSTAISLWANPIEPSDWGYPKQRDTRSRDFAILNNVFIGNRVALRIANTTASQLRGNRLLAVDSPFVVRDSATQIVIASNDTSALRRPRAQVVTVVRPAAAPVREVTLPTALSGGFPVSANAVANRDRAAIIIDEWGPYDYRSPKLWPVDSSFANPMRLRVLGPPGSWRAVELRGAALSKQSGNVGDTIVVAPLAGALNDWQVTLEYRGAATTSPRGERRTAGEPYRFSYSRFQPISAWDVRFYTFADSTDPRTRPDAIAALERGTPIVGRSDARLDYMWYRPTIPNLPQAGFATIATATVDVPAGDYTLRSISDDAIRVYVDGQLVIDSWTAHDSRVDHAPITPGRHTLRVEHYNSNGWTELRVEVVRGVARSVGSPGPH